MNELSLTLVPKDLFYVERALVQRQATEIGNLQQRLQERTTERDYHLRMADKLAERVRELEAQVEQLKAVIVADTHVLLSKRPVAFRVKDFADGWILFDDEETANITAEKMGALMQGLYARDGK